MEISGNAIMKGNEEAWIRMALEDEDMLKQMGLPLNMTSDQIEEAVSIMLPKVISETTVEKQEKQEVDGSQYDKSEVITYRDMEIGGEYILTANNGQVIHCKLQSIRPGSFMPDDYFFQNIKGGENLLGHSAKGVMPDDVFPMTSGIIEYFEVKRV